MRTFSGTAQKSVVNSGVDSLELCNQAVNGGREGRYLETLHDTFGGRVRNFFLDFVGLADDCFLRGLNCLFSVANLSRTFTLTLSIAR